MSSRPTNGTECEIAAGKPKFGKIWGRTVGQWLVGGCRRRMANSRIPGAGMGQAEWRRRGNRAIRCLSLRPMSTSSRSSESCM
eukprot:758052-Hanusia_phi.AAC.3